ncbi:FAD binding domain-containing protein [Microbacterium sediminis]|uniref:FAD-binding molybdopterin dehydrogenase n=1 Tax=Microbacterium sediminis TaxID=904291 RepID=A0A1B9NBJ8_9MICO|nr:FAD binding domain-containing protein [Microbacterium sediminis]OCG73953.1 FAD-binding molybdopterin dehydrogenase [Microbacterium sediminis]
MDLVDVQTLRVARTTADLVLAPGERAMGGGTWLFSEPQPGTTGVVDLMGLGWPDLEDLPEGGLRIAATCTLAALAASGRHPLFLSACESLLASFKVWNAATVGGNVCLGLPAGALVSLAAGLDGVAVLWTADAAGGLTERRLPVLDFVTGAAQTALRPGEVLRAIDFPAAALRARSALRKLALSPLGRSGVVVVGRQDEDGAVAITVSAATLRPRRLAFAAPPSEEELAAAVAGIDDWFGDAPGAADWRRAQGLRLAIEVLGEVTG